MSESYAEEGRVNQKRRTRAALLAAANQLLHNGTLPSVAEAADAASVSRATAYRYFPSQEHLLHEVALDTAARDVDHVLDSAPIEGTAAERLDAVVLAVYRLVTSNDLAFRTLLKLSLEHKGEEQADTAGVIRRVGRRLRWVEEALDALREQLDATRFARLVTALALCTGIETQIVLRDVCALDQDEAEKVTRWAAQALLRASLSERASEAP